jgi:hypothetical protein
LTLIQQLVYMRGIHAPRITQALPSAVTDSHVRLGGGRFWLARA